MMNVGWEEFAAFEAMYTLVRYWFKVSGDDRWKSIALVSFSSTVHKVLLTSSRWVYVSWVYIHSFMQNDKKSSNIAPHRF